MEEVISILLHLTLTHLEDKNTNARILRVDFSSAFNTILLQQLVEKMKLLGVGTNTCNWVLDFLTERKQTVKVNSRTSNTITVSTGSPQGCVLSPLLFTLLTHDCTAIHNANHIIKFADDTTIVGLINGDESPYRDEVEACITSWYGNSRAEERQRLGRVIKTAETIIGVPLFPLLDIYNKRCTGRGKRIIQDSSHPCHRHFSLLLSGRRYRSIRTRTSRLRNSFFPSTVRLLNAQQ